MKVGNAKVQKNVRPSGETSPSGALQTRADASAPVQRLRHLASQAHPAHPAGAGPVLQREPVTLMASYQDGKIGSIYFDSSRIRGVHSSGPRETRDDANSKRKTYRFNVDADAAFEAYAAQDGKYLALAETKAKADTSVAYEVALKREKWRAVRGRVAKDLEGKSKDDLPSWATLIEGVDDAPDLETASEQNLRLLELFEKEGEGFGTPHASRGFLAKFETSDEDIELIRAALEMSRNGKDAGARNRLFYKYIKGRNPALAEKFHAA